MVGKRSATMLVLVVAVGCMQSTASRTPTLQLVDGTGSTITSGSIQQSAAAKQSPTGIDITFTLKWMGARDTVMALSPCAPPVRLYTAMAGGTMVYPTDGGSVCIALAALVTFVPGQERTQQVTLGSDSVARKLSPSRYYIRLVPLYATASGELLAGVVDRP